MGWKFLKFSVDKAGPCAIMGANRNPNRGYGPTTQESETMAKQVQITKAWGVGSIPATKGSYIVCGPDRSGVRFIDAVPVGNGIKAFYMDGTEVRQDNALRHFGPLPGIERSIAAQARSAEEAPAQAN